MGSFLNQGPLVIRVPYYTGDLKRDPMNVFRDLSIWALRGFCEGVRNCCHFKSPALGMLFGSSVRRSWHPKP